MTIHSMDGRTIAGAADGANVDLVKMLRTMLEEAEAGRLVVFAGVIGSTEKGRLDFRFATHTNNWEVHDRLLARVGALRTMMENDLLSKLELVAPLEGGPGGGDDAA